MTIRQARVDDLGEILVIERASETAPHWAEGEYRAMLGEQGSAGVRRCLYVASRDHGDAPVVAFAVGQVLGTAPEVDAEIESVVVRETERRQGLGRALCRAVMTWAAGEGATAIGLEVRAQSAGAIRLYAELGFMAVARRPGYYERPADDAVVMRCRLDGRNV